MCHFVHKRPMSIHRCSDLRFVPWLSPNWKWPQSRGGGAASHTLLSSFKGQFTLIIALQVTSRVHFFFFPTSILHELSLAGPSPGISSFADSEDTGAEEPYRRGETQSYNLYTWIGNKNIYISIYFN